MAVFEEIIQLRWSDLDPNFHLRHSIYYDWGAMNRINYLNGQGLTPSKMEEMHFGPIIFREECIFRKEIRFGDIVTIDLQLVKAKRDCSRWTIGHTVKKNGDTVSALLTIDGAWINTQLRKLAVPPAEVQAIFNAMPLGKDFQWLD